MLPFPLLLVIESLSVTRLLLLARWHAALARSLWRRRSRAQSQSLQPPGPLLGMPPDDSKVWLSIGGKEEVEANQGPSDPQMTRKKSPECEHFPRTVLQRSPSKRAGNVPKFIVSLLPHAHHFCNFCSPKAHIDTKLRVLLLFSSGIWILVLICKCILLAPEFLSHRVSSFV